MDTMTPPPLPRHEELVRRRRRRLVVALAVGAVVLLLWGLMELLAGGALRSFRDGGFDLAGAGRAARGGDVAADSAEPAAADSGNDATATDASNLVAAAASITRPLRKVPSKSDARGVTPADSDVENSDVRASRKLDPKTRRPTKFVIPPPGKVNRSAAARGGDLAAVSDVKSGFRSMFAGRSDARRGKLLESGGGTRESENAVDSGLQWLKKHQHPSGNWSLNQFHQVDGCQGRCGDQGCGTLSDTAATGLALLPFLGRGYTHRGKAYNKLIRSALTWILADQNDNGSFDSIGYGNMYAHAQATIALCEALSMTGDTRLLLKPATAAVAYIVDAQSDGGGWRYRPKDPGDTSVQGWQIMALGSAVDAGIAVDANVFAQSNRFLDTTSADKVGGLYSYQPGGTVTPTMTAEALLCRQYCGWSSTHGGLKFGVDYLSRNLPKRDTTNMYYWYYATQVLHHWGGDEWKRWNDTIRELLIETQETAGHKRGSWAPHGTGHDRGGGRVYMTALALCTLEVYYRHLPIFRVRAGGVGQ